MAEHMRPPRRRTGRILRGIVTHAGSLASRGDHGSHTDGAGRADAAYSVEGTAHAGGRVGPRRRANPPGGRIISTRELTYVRRRLTVLIAMFSVVTMVVLLSVRGCSNDGDGSSGSVSSAGAARSGATVDPTDGSVADDGSSDKSGPGRVRSQSASRSMFKAAVPAPAQPERDLTAQASAALAGVFSGARYSVSVVDLSNAGTLVDIDSSQVFASASTYKLFVAHSMVTAVELGEMTWDSPLNGMTLQQCLTTMIVDSDNECPKAWLMRDNGTGYDKVTQQANALGAKNTTLHYLDVRTTSADLALILTKLYRGEIWNDDDRDMVIGLMKRQQYRSGIPAGIGGNGTVADKVGFRDSYLHDAGIVYSGKGDYAFVIMTSGSSWTAIANASAALYQLL